MTIDINSYADNEKLYKAMQKADSQGAKAYNGKLDAEEISLFVSEAQKLGCAIDEIMDVVHTDGTDTTSNENTDIQEKVKLLGKIDNLAKTIKSKEQELETLKKEYADTKPGFWESSSIAQKVGTVIGAAAGAVVGGAVVALTLPVSLPILAGATVVGGGLGTLAGAWDGMFIGSLFNNDKPYEAMVKEKQVSEIDNRIYDKQAEINQLKDELQELYESLFE